MYNIRYEIYYSYIPGLIFGHCSLVNLSSSNSCPAATNSNRVNSPLPLPLKYVTLIDDISLHTVTLTTCLLVFIKFIIRILSEFYLTYDEMQTKG